MTSVQEARAAIALGVESVELCTWLACGGVTPSTGLVRAVAGENPGRLRVLCRPGPGGFSCSTEDLNLMLSDARLLAQEKGVHGVVLGGFTASGEMPLAQYRDFRRESVEITFHRAIDHANDRIGVLQQCIDVGFERVLSSGGETLAMDGAPMLRRMVEAAQGRIIVAAAGGINASNVVELVERTGVCEVHFSAQKPSGQTIRGAAMSSAHADAQFATEPDPSKIEAVLQALAKAGLR